jgi:hypothetical protein
MRKFEFSSLVFVYIFDTEGYCVKHGICEESNLYYVSNGLRQAKAFHELIRLNLGRNITEYREKSYLLDSTIWGNMRDYDIIKNSIRANLSRGSQIQFIPCNSDKEESRFKSEGRVLTTDSFINIIMKEKRLYGFTPTTFSERIDLLFKFAITKIEKNINEKCLPYHSEG